MPKLIRVFTAYKAQIIEFIMQWHKMNENKMTLVVRKPVFGVSDQVQHKPGFAVTGEGLKLDCTIRVAKTKALISFVVTAKLICVFVYAYEKKQFSYDVAQI